MSPLVKTDFTIVLETADPFSEFRGPITPPALLSHPHYWMTGGVNGEGVIDAEYWRPGTEPQTASSTGMESVQESRCSGQVKPRCGPFAFRFSSLGPDPAKILNP